MKKKLKVNFCVVLAVLSLLSSDAFGGIKEKLAEARQPLQSLRQQPLEFSLSSAYVSGLREGVQSIAFQVSEVAGYASEWIKSPIVRILTVSLVNEYISAKMTTALHEIAGHGALGAHSGLTDYMVQKQLRSTVSTVLYCMECGLTAVRFIPNMIKDG